MNYLELIKERLEEADRLAGNLNSEVFYTRTREQDLQMSIKQALIDLYKLQIALNE